MKLIEWTEHYIDHVNSFKRNVISKEVLEDKIICQTNNGETTYYICEDLRQIKNEGNSIFVTLNSKKSLKFLTDNWDFFSNNNKLKIMFVNPSENLHWSLFPYTHNLISEKIKPGLLALFTSIPEV